MNYQMSNSLNNNSNEDQLVYVSEENKDNSSDFNNYYNSNNLNNNQDSSSKNFENDKNKGKIKFLDNLVFKISLFFIFLIPLFFLPNFILPLDISKIFLITTYVLIASVIISYKNILSKSFNFSKSYLFYALISIPLISLISFISNKTIITYLF